MLRFRNGSIGIPLFAHCTHWNWSKLCEHHLKTFFVTNSQELQYLKITKQKNSYQAGRTVKQGRCTSDEAAPTAFDIYFCSGLRGRLMLSFSTRTNEVFYTAMAQTLLLFASGTQTAEPSASPTITNYVHFSRLYAVMCPRG